MKLITASQSRAARGLLNWSQPELAERCGVHVQTISSFEQDSGSPTKKTLQKIAEAYEKSDIEFSEDDDGVRRRKSNITKYSNVEGFRDFMDDVYHTSKNYGGDIFLFNSKPALWHDWLGKEWYDMHAKRMRALKDKIRVRIVLQPGDKNFILDIAEYRWFSKAIKQERIFYAYGPKLGFLEFSKNNVSITVLHQKEFTDIFRVLYDIAWEYVSIEPH